MYVFILFAIVSIANYILLRAGKKDLERHGISVPLLMVHVYINFTARDVPTEVRRAYIWRFIVGGIGFFILFFLLF